MSDETDTSASADTPAETPLETLSDSYDEAEAQKNTGADDDAPKQDSPDTDQKADQGKGDDKSDDASDESSKAEGTDDKPKEDSDSDKKGEDQDGDKEDDDAEEALSYEEFVLPEGYQLDTKLSEKALPILAKYKVPQEEVQNIVDEIVAGQSEFAKKASDDHAKLVQGWGKDTKEHFGQDGDAAFDEKSATAKLAMDHFFSPDEMRYIDAWGVGNMPGLFAAMNTIGNAMKEDNSFASNAGNSNTEETVADIWYPNSNG